MEVGELAEVWGKQIVSSLRISGFEVDSRKIKPGDLFFALPGAKVDGHDFLKEARLKGAIGAVVSKKIPMEGEGFFLIQVEDVLKALQTLAAYKREKQKSKCVAITGSVGKTTTKEFLYDLLKGSFRVGKTWGNANSQVGLPLSLLNENEEAEVFVAELGMSQKGEIASLLPIVAPDFVIVTKVSLAHALYFPRGLEEIAEAKAEILGHPRIQKAFLNGDIRRFAAFQRDSLPFFFYGQGSGLQKQDAELLCLEGKFAIRIKEEKTRDFTLPFQAKHLAENFLAAALVARELGVEWELIFQRAANLCPYKMRFEQTEKEGVIYINDAYNASPASMKAALENLPSPGPGSKIIAVLGEMRELGQFSREAHEEIGKIASKQADLLLCLGQECLPMAEAFEHSGRPSFHFTCMKLLKEKLQQEARQGDVILVKASNSLKMWEVLE